MIEYNDFSFKPFLEMTPDDYAFIGFKSGLEVHQQLLTDKKLFCNCPAGKYNEHFHAEILRHMRPTLSELGEYDGTALMEFKTKKEIIYRIHYDTVCTYEMDDTPPFLINEQALDIAIEIALLLNSSIVDEIHIARKQYLDGSIPTGFQRTAIVSVGGHIPYKDDKINIIQLSIEEDSCREYSDIGHMRTYLTDRLSMPLIETVTAPEMKTPIEVAEVNNILRRVFRSTNKVRTGIGAARQDVNVSVHGGTRIEIKGVSKIPYIPLLTFNEAMRQWNLLRLRTELHRRGINHQSFSASYENVTKLVRKTRYKPITDAIGEGKTVNCVLLRGYRGLLKWETQTDTYFSNELSDRVRVIACLTTLPNIIHSDSPSENLYSAEWHNLKKYMRATDDDAIVLVWGDEADAETGAKEIIIRAHEATLGVPPETRQALRDGTNGFERILPGPNRMYPDTDLPPKKITGIRIENIRNNLPIQFWTLESKYRKLGVPEDLIKDLAISPYIKIFDEATNDFKIDAKLAATILIQFPKRLKKRGLEVDKLKEEIFMRIFNDLFNGKIEKDYILYIMENTIKNGSIPRTKRKIDEKKLNIELTKVIKKISKMRLFDESKKGKIIMGMLMKRVKGRIGANVVKDFIENNTGLLV